MTNSKSTRTAKAVAPQPVLLTPPEPLRIVTVYARPLSPDVVPVLALMTTVPAVGEAPAFYAITALGKYELGGEILWDGVSVSVLAPHSDVLAALSHLRDIVMIKRYREPVAYLAGFTSAIAVR